MQLDGQFAMWNVTAVECPEYRSRFLPIYVRYICVN